MKFVESRAGKTQQQGTHSTAYLAFVPADLPPSPPIDFDMEMIGLMSEADLALGQLSGIASLLPNPDLFVAMYVKKEAVLSSQIEGIQCTLDDVLQQEVDEDGVRTKDISEVVNYVNAMNYGIERLKTLPLSLRLIREMHERLMQGVRGEHKDPGEFRRSQNWIGPQGCTLTNASFVPPPVHLLQNALSNFESFMHNRGQLPIAIQCAILHAQFETIHPFLDGNGRVGRLLVSLLLHERNVLKQPLLYISLYLKQNRLDYYDRLTAVRQNGDWEGWVKFFLRGVVQVSNEASLTAQRIVEFREKVLFNARSMGKNELALVDHLFSQPIMDIRTAERLLGCSYVTASNALQNFVKSGYVTEATGQKRNKLYKFSGYLSLFDETQPSHENDGDGDGSGGGVSGGPPTRKSGPGFQ